MVLYKVALGASSRELSLHRTIEKVREAIEVQFLKGNTGYNIYKFHKSTNEWKRVADQTLTTILKKNKSKFRSL